MTEHASTEQSVSRRTGGRKGRQQARSQTVRPRSPYIQRRIATHDILDEEGLCLGLSSGINVAGAMALARELGPGKRIATILCDSGFRYLSTLYNPDWLASKGLQTAA